MIQRVGWLLYFSLTMTPVSIRQQFYSGLRQRGITTPLASWSNSPDPRRIPIPRICQSIGLGGLVFIDVR